MDIFLKYFMQLFLYKNFYDNLLTKENLLFKRLINRIYKKE